MGQKVSPHGLRVGVIKDWDSKWYAGKHNFADMLVEDNQIRTFVKKKLYAAGVARVLVERPAETKVRVTVLVARPGMVIGRNGAGADEVKAALVKQRWMHSLRLNPLLSLWREEYPSVEL